MFAHTFYVNRNLKDLVCVLWLVEHQSPVLIESLGEDVVIYKSQAERGCYSGPKVSLQGLSLVHQIVAH